MKKNLKMFIACGVLLAALPLMADTETVGGYTWTYRINGDTAEIYNGGSCAVSTAPTGAVTIPDTLGRKPVTSIGDYAFYGCSNLTSVTMAENVVNIGAYAFENCSGITNIATRYYASLNVQDIGDGAFLGCSGLADADGFVIIAGVLYGYFGTIKDVTIPEWVYRISSRAFQGRSDVTTISIPDCTRSFCCDAFDGCGAVVNQDGFIVVGNALCRYLGNSNDIVVPDNVKIIADKAFLGNVDLTHVAISTNLECIGTDAFAGCTNLVVNIECPCPENYAYSGIVDVKEILFPTNDVYYDTYEISNYATALSAWVEAALYIDALGILQVTGSYYNDQTFNESYSYLEGWVDRIGEEFSLGLRVVGGDCREYVIPVSRDNISTSYFGNWTIHVPCPWEAVQSGPSSVSLVLSSHIYHGTLQSNDQWPWAPLIQITSGNIVNCSQKVFRPGDIVAFDGPSGYYYYGGLNRIEGLENYDLWNIFDNLYNGYMDIMGTCHNGVYYWRVPSAYDIVGCDAALLGEVSISTYDAASPYRRYRVDAGCFYGIWERYADDIACEILPEIETVVATFDLGQHSEGETMFQQRKERYHLIQDPWASTWETLVFTNPSSGVESHESDWLVEDGWRFIGWKLVSGCVKPDAYSSQAMNLGTIVPSVDGFCIESDCVFEAQYEIAFTYSALDDWGMCVTGCDGSCPADIVVPESHDDMPIRAIAAGAFSNETSICSVHLPNTVTEIGAFAFYGCTSLTNIVLSTRLLTFSANDSVCNGDCIVSIVAPNESLDALPELVCEEYQWRFDGWWTDIQDGERISATDVEPGVRYYARFALKKLGSMELSTTWFSTEEAYDIFHYADYSDDDQMNYYFPYNLIEALYYETGEAVPDSVERDICAWGWFSIVESATGEGIDYYQYIHAGEYTLRVYDYDSGSEVSAQFTVYPVDYGSWSAYASYGISDGNGMATSLVISGNNECDVYLGAFTNSNEIVIEYVPDGYNGCGFGGIEHPGITITGDCSDESHWQIVREELYNGANTSVNISSTRIKFNAAGHYRINIKTDGNSFYDGYGTGWVEGMDATLNVYVEALPFSDVSVSVESSLVYTGASVEPSWWYHPVQNPVVQDGVVFTDSNGSLPIPLEGDLRILFDKMTSCYIEYPLSATNAGTYTLTIGADYSAFGGCYIPPGGTWEWGVDGHAVQSWQDREWYYYIPYADDHDEQPYSLYPYCGAVNYTGAVEVAVTVLPRPVAKEQSVFNLRELHCDGTLQTCSVVITNDYNGAVLVEGRDYDVAYTNNILAGTATATVTCKGNYSGTFSQSFEILPSTNVVEVLGLDKKWTTGGDAEWFAEWFEPAHDGVSCMRSGAIGDNQESWIETVVTNTGVVSFWWKASSEEYRGVAYDKVVFSVDDVDVASIGGEVDWTNVTYAVEGNGPHVLRWTYYKDASDYGGQDCAWLDEVQYLREVRVAFADGGATEGSVPASETIGEGLQITLPDQGSLAWPKHRFSGWSTGDEIIAPGTLYALGYDDLTFTAVWEEKRVSAPTIEVAAWYDTERTAVTMGCETAGATIHYTLDGSTPTSASPVYAGSFYFAGSATIRAIAVLDDFFDSDVVAAESVRAPWTPDECLNAPGLAFNMGGDAIWVRDRTMTHDGDTAMRSSEIGDNQTSWVEASVSGAGTLTFWWKVSSEAYKGTIYDYARFTVDGVAVVSDIGGEINWRSESVTITDGGTHTFRWAYVKDAQNTNGSDCAWLDEVTWVPVESPNPIPLVASDSEVAAALAGTTDASITANVTNAAQYVAYRSWALSVTNATTTAQMIKESTRTWLSYAFGADALIAKELTSDDVKIESFTPASTDGQFEFTVSVKDVNIGGGSVEVETLKENLKKVLGIEGAATLSPGGFSSDNIDITFDAPVDGKARFTVSPPADAGNSFFMRVKVK